ncbi:redoxin domain-containing protein [Candidatus Bipolaricaulota bacterium]
MRRRRTWMDWVVLAVGVGSIVHLSGCTRPDGIRAVLEARPSEGVAPLTVEFDLDETSVGESGGSFFLEFGDGTPMVEGSDFRLNVSHVYELPGTFIAELAVIGSDGEVDQDEVPITVGDGLPAEGSGIGDRAIDFSAPTTDGATVTLSELLGRVVLIEFWGSWCTPCRESMPHINSLWEEFHEQGLVVLAVSTDATAADSTQYLEANGFYGLICIWEPGGKTTRIKVMYDVGWIPRTIVIDKQGIVRFNGHPVTLQSAFLATLIAE